MTDLLSTIPAPKRPSRNVGYGNAMFLADLAEGVPDSALRQRIREGAYPHLHRPSITGWRALVGRAPNPTAQIMTRSEV